jgi:hypothetical protein
MLIGSQEYPPFKAGRQETGLALHIPFANSKLSKYYELEARVTPQTKATRNQLQQQQA